MPYSTNKTIEGLDSVTGDVVSTDHSLISRSGNTYRATFDKILNFIFGAKTEQTTTVSSDIVLIKRGTSINQATLANLLPADAVTTSKLASNSVTSAKLASSANSADRAVGANHIQDNAIETSRIATGAIVESKMAAESVNTSALKAEAVTDAKISPNSISASKLSQSTTSNSNGNPQRIVSLLNPPTFNEWESYSNTTNLPNSSLQHYRTINRSLGRVAINVVVPKTIFPGGTGTNATYGGAFSGSVLLPDGRIFLVPFNHSEVWIYDPIKDSYTIPNSGGTGLGVNQGLYMGGILMPPSTTSSYLDSNLTSQGYRVLCIPYNKKAPLIYNVSNNSCSSPLDNASLPLKGFCGGVLLPTQMGVGTQRKVLLAPYESSQPYTMSYNGDLAALSGVSLTSPKAHGAILTSSGNAVFFTSTGRAVLNTTSGTISHSTGAYANRYPVATADGHQILIPVTASSNNIVRVSDTDMALQAEYGTVGTIANGGCFGAVRFPCGAILGLGMGMNTQPFLIDETLTSGINILNNSVLGSPGWGAQGMTGVTGTDLGRSPFSGGVLLPDGRAFITPCTSTTARIVSVRTSVCPLDWNVILGPNNNKL
jgi:hypothetical protein